MSPAELDTFNRQFDAVFSDSQEARVKTRDEYRGRSYDSYLRGVKQVEDRLTSKGGSNANTNRSIR